MKRWIGIGLALAALGTISPARSTDAPFPVPTSQEVTPGVWMIPGGIRPNRQPDGNSVVFDAPAGLIVIDTGHHAWHRAALLSLARQQEKQIVAIVNTHWHLDHVSGNAGLHAAYPGLRVYASDAIDGALAGFLPASAKDSARYLEDPQVPAEMREDIRGDQLTIRSGAALRPDVVIGNSGRMELGGRARMGGAADTVDLRPVRCQASHGDLGPRLPLPLPDAWSAPREQIKEA